MQIALHGTVKDPPVLAETAEKPVATYQVAPATVYPSAIGSSNEYSMLNVAAPDVMAAPIPTLKGVWKSSTAQAALLPVPDFVIVVSFIALFL